MTPINRTTNPNTEMMTAAIPERTVLGTNQGPIIKMTPKMINNVELNPEFEVLVCVGVE
jgi:hypothetical protein